MLLSFFLMRRPPPRSTLFPYTTLFRSKPRKKFRGKRWRNSSVAKCRRRRPPRSSSSTPPPARRCRFPRSEEHTSELQSRQYLVCRLLLEKKKITKKNQNKSIVDYYARS